MFTRCAMFLFVLLLPVCAMADTTDSTEQIPVLSLVLMIAGGIVWFIGGIMFLVVAFRESVLWGLGCLFVPFVSLIFLVMHWQDAKGAFGLILLGAVAFYGGVWMAPGAVF